MEENICWHMCEKSLVSRIHQELIQLNNKNINKPIKKWAVDLKIYLSIEDTEMAKKKHEKMLNLISYQRNANQNCSETPLYIHWGGYKFKVLIKKCE